MELDDLKKTWNENTINKKTNTDIMELLQHKSYGPVAAMKRAFRKQIIFLAIVPFVLILTNLDDVHAALTSIIFWSYVCFCIGMIAFASYNYRVVRKLEVMDGMVSTNIEQQIELLEKRKKLEILCMRCVLLFFILLTEVVPYFQHYRSLTMWHSVPVAVRVACYAALVTVQYFTNRMMAERNIGQHLTYLRKLMSEFKE